MSHCWHTLLCFGLQHMTRICTIVTTTVHQEPIMFVVALQAAYQEVQAFAKFGAGGTRSVAAFNHRGSSGAVLVPETPRSAGHLAPVMLTA